MFIYYNRVSELIQTPYLYAKKNYYQGLPPPPDPPVRLEVAVDVVPLSFTVYEVLLVIPGTLIMIVMLPLFEPPPGPHPPLLPPEGLV